MRKRLYSLHIYRLLIQMSVRGMMQYRADFWTSLAGVFILNSANIAQMSIIAWKFTSLGTWTVGDLMVLYGLYMVSFSLYSVFFGRIPELQNEVIQGTFDKYMLRPVGTLLQFIGGGINYTGICDTLLGLCLLFVGKEMAGIVWGVRDLLLMLLFILCGGTIIVSIRLMLACVSFWAVKAESLDSMLTQVLLLSQKYPVAIFGDVFKLFVTGIIPIAFLNYYPAVYLLRKGTEPAWLCLLSPVVAAVFVALTALVWKRGTRRYGSAGG